MDQEWQFRSIRVRRLEVWRVVNKKVFIICPIGADDGLERAGSDKLLKYVIHPVMKELISDPSEDVTVRSDKMGELGESLCRFFAS
jgi:hypothetical protein